jgi:hypothetical protein
MPRGRELTDEERAVIDALHYGSSPTRRSGTLMDPIVLSGIGMINERKSSTNQGDRLVVEAS